MKRFACLWLLTALLALPMGCAPQESAGAAAPTAAAAETPAMVVMAPDGSKAAPIQTPAPAPEPAETPAPAPAPTPFTILWLSDTQRMAYDIPAPLLVMGEWAEANRETENIILALHTGDITDNGWKDAQWENVARLLDPIRRAGIPLLTVAGNHDLGQKKQDYGAYLEKHPWDTLPEAMEYDGGKAVAYAFSAGGADFIAVGVGWSAEQEASDFAVKTFAAHPDSIGILFVHGYYKSEEDALGFTAQGKILNANIVAACPNIRYVLCGHNDGVRLETEWYDDDGDGQAERAVTGMMYNYQASSRKLGYLRTLRFDPADRSIRVRTYSPYAEDEDFYEDERRLKETFVLENAF